MAGRARGFLPLGNLELSRDIYGFTVRPQHIQRYREYAKIYKEEEEERSERWENFLENYVQSHPLSTVDQSGTDDTIAKDESLNGEKESVTFVESLTEDIQQGRENNAQTWSDIRPSLDAIEQILSVRIKKKRTFIASKDAGNTKKALSTDETKHSRLGSLVSEEDSEEEFYDVERSDPVHDSQNHESIFNDSAGSSLSSQASLAASCGWIQELESLVRGGVPMALRKELWQAFVGTRIRKIDNYYNDLLTMNENQGLGDNKDSSIVDNEKSNSVSNLKHFEKWKNQIEKDLPRTFPGHPALDEDGRNALRRLLTAYARHNPAVGYCQAMNFFAGLLLLLMPEENAFWTLIGIIDDYFDGYYSEKMVESQVDQLVYEELVREFFPRLVSHFDRLGVQVAWVTGPWFLSIFVNVLPWESVLRVWDVLLFEGNRTMLFRTALALLDLYGPALLTTKDAGDAVTLLQSLAGSTFDSSQLVLTACMGYQPVDEARLQELRQKHRPTVLAAIEERFKDPRLWKAPKYSTKTYKERQKKGEHVLGEDNSDAVTEKEGTDLDQKASSTSSGSIEHNDLDSFLNGLTDVEETNSNEDLPEQVIWLKNGICQALEEKRSAVLRCHT